MSLLNKKKNFQNLLRCCWYQATFTHTASVINPTDERSGVTYFPDYHINNLSVFPESVDVSKAPPASNGSAGHSRFLLTGPHTTFQTFPSPHSPSRQSEDPAVLLVYLQSRAPFPKLWPQGLPGPEETPRTCSDSTPPQVHAQTRTVRPASTAPRRPPHPPALHSQPAQPQRAPQRLRNRSPEQRKAASRGRPPRQGGASPAPSPQTPRQRDPQDPAVLRPRARGRPSATSKAAGAPSADLFSARGAPGEAAVGARPPEEPGRASPLTAVS